MYHVWVCKCTISYQYYSHRWRQWKHIDSITYKNRSPKIWRSVDESTGNPLIFTFHHFCTLALACLIWKFRQQQAAQMKTVKWQITHDTTCWEMGIWKYDLVWNIWQHVTYSMLNWSMTNWICYKLLSLILFGIHEFIWYHTNSQYLKKIYILEVWFCFMFKLFACYSK